MSLQLRRVIQERLKVLEERDELLKLEQQRLSMEPKRKSVQRSASNRHTHARRGAVLDTKITEAVRETFFGIAPGFDVHDSIKIMRTNGYQFQCANPVGAVSGVLRKLARKQNAEIAVVSEGRGGKPSKYKKLR